MPWGPNFKRFTALVEADDKENYIAIAKKYGKLTGDDPSIESDDLLGQAIDYVTNPPPHPMDDTEYNEIIAGDDLWASIQTNSGK